MLAKVHFLYVSEIQMTNLQIPPTILPSNQNTCTLPSSCKELKADSTSLQIGGYYQHV